MNDSEHPPAPSDGNEVVLIYCPVPTDDAPRLARLVVRERLAACVHAAPAGRSWYWWAGEIVEGEETGLLMKTRRAHVAGLLALLERTHPYEVPALIVLRPEQVNASWAAWLVEETPSRECPSDRG
jgi:periplasmic divalent cation tolerance protein